MSVLYQSINQFYIFRTPLLLGHDGCYVGTELTTYWEGKQRLYIMVYAPSRFLAYMAFDGQGAGKINGMVVKVLSNVIGFGETWVRVHL